MAAGFLRNAGLRRSRQKLNGFSDPGSEILQHHWVTEGQPRFKTGGLTPPLSSGVAESRYRKAGKMTGLQPPFKYNLSPIGCHRDNGLAAPTLRDPKTLIPISSAHSWPRAKELALC